MVRARTTKFGIQSYKLRIWLGGELKLSSLKGARGCIKPYRKEIHPGRGWLGACPTHLPGRIAPAVSLPPQVPVREAMGGLKPPPFIQENC